MCLLVQVTSDNFQFKFFLINRIKSSTFICAILGYFDGVVGNLNLLDQYYKGWKIRLYHDFDAGNTIWKVINLEYTFYQIKSFNKTTKM